MDSKRAYVFPVADHAVAAADASNAEASSQTGAQVPPPPPTSSTRSCYHFDHTSNSGHSATSHAHYAPYTTYSSSRPRPNELPKTGTAVSAVEDMAANAAAKRPGKTHVPSACMNCKKAHLACDVSRPCKRCVSLGKVDTCIDIKHKKRGRPKLKDKGNRPYSTHAAADTKTWAQAASTTQYVPSTQSAMTSVTVMPQQSFANNYIPSSAPPQPPPPPPQAAQPPSSQQQQYQQQQHQHQHQHQQRQVQHQHQQHHHHLHQQHQQQRHQHPHPHHPHHLPHHHHQQHQQQQHHHQPQPQPQHQQQPPMQASHPYPHLHPHPPSHSHPQPYPQSHVVKTSSWSIHPQPHVLPPASTYAPIVPPATGFTSPDSQMTMFLTVEGMSCARVSEECLGLTGFYPSELMHRPLHECVSSSEDAESLKRLLISLRENMDKFYNTIHAHSSALPSQPFTEPPLTTQEPEFQTMATEQLSLPAHGCPTRIEVGDMIGLRQRNGQFDLYNVRMYLGGALGGDLTKKETWHRLYIVASFTRTKPGGSACTTMTAATTVTTTTTTRASAPYDVVSPVPLQKMDPYHGETLARPVSYGQPYVDAPSQPFPRQAQSHHPSHYYQQQQHAQSIPRPGEFATLQPTTTPNSVPSFDPYPLDRHSKPPVHGYIQQHPQHPQHPHRQHHQHNHSTLQQSSTSSCCQSSSSSSSSSSYPHVDHVDHCNSAPSSSATTNTTTGRMSVDALLC